MSDLVSCLDGVRIGRMGINKCTAGNDVLLTVYDASANGKGFGDEQLSFVPDELLAFCREVIRIANVPREGADMKTVTVVYEIVDESEWAKRNPLHYAHDGLRALRVAAGNALDEIDKTYRAWCGRDFMHLPLCEAVGEAMSRRHPLTCCHRCGEVIEHGHDCDQPEWISVKDRFPDDMRDVLTAGRYGVHKACFEWGTEDDPCWWSDEVRKADFKSSVTHWAELRTASLDRKDARP